MDDIPAAWLKKPEATSIEVLLANFREMEQSSSQDEHRNGHDENLGQGKEEQGKEEQGKEGQGEEEHGKEKHGREEHGKEVYGKEVSDEKEWSRIEGSPGEENIKQSHDAADIPAGHLALDTLGHALPSNNEQDTESAVGGNQEEVDMNLSSGPEPDTSPDPPQTQEPPQAELHPTAFSTHIPIEILRIRLQQPDMHQHVEYIREVYGGFDNSKFEALRECLSKVQPGTGLPDARVLRNAIFCLDEAGWDVDEAVRTGRFGLRGWIDSAEIW